MVAKLPFLIILAFCVPIWGANDEVQCNENYKCVPLSQCQIADGMSSFFYPCHSGLNLICCPPGSYNVSNTALEIRKASLFPVKCGVMLVADRITGGVMADLGEFPWMALLGYRQRDVDYTQFLCGGSIITEKYILTAAHCIKIDDRLELVLVRLGEQNLLTDVDCLDINGVQVCADRYVETPVERLIPHQDFNKDKLIHDIALIKVKNKITFTEFIQPVCLPFERDLEGRDLTNQQFTVSGWGKTKSANLGGSTVLQYTKVAVWNQKRCNASVPPEVKPIRSSQMCANGNKTEDACKGDSGGPLVNATSDADGEFRFFQIGIVSFASTLTCGNPELATVYTRVDKYLNWITKYVV